MPVHSWVTLNDIDYDIVFEPTKIQISNSGIGGYEFWGYKGFDRGHEFVEDFDISNLEILDRDTGEELDILNPEFCSKIEDAIRTTRRVLEAVDEWYDYMRDTERD